MRIGGSLASSYILADDRDRGHFRRSIVANDDHCNASGPQTPNAGGFEPALAPLVLGGGSAGFIRSESLQTIAELPLRSCLTPG
jgi:hypothetical protein